MLKVENIDASYGDVQVLWDVSFEVREGELLALLARCAFCSAAWFASNQAPALSFMLAFQSYSKPYVKAACRVGPGSSATANKLRAKAT